MRVSLGLRLGSSQDSTLNTRKTFFFFVCVSLLKIVLLFFGVIVAGSIQVLSASKAL